MIESSIKECPVFSTIDSHTNMPNEEYLQSKTDTQKLKNLSQERIISSIPKCNHPDLASSGSNSDCWLYPSPQMFYRALSEKGKNPPEDENDLQGMLTIHNWLNESVWNEIKCKENTLGRTNIRLLKFEGKPEVLSPRAWFFTKFLNSPHPFDRHDWIVVDQDSGTHSRYVIDFYDSTAPVSFKQSSPSFNCDIRIAIDNPRSFYDRIRLFFIKE